VRGQRERETEGGRRWRLRDAERGKGRERKGEGKEGDR